MNIQDLKALVGDLQNTSITRLEIESEGLKVKIDYQRSGAPLSFPAAVTLVRAPIAGTLGPSGDKPLIKEGDAVEVGLVLCVIDEGQTNEIESDVSGRVAAVHAKPGEPVTAGQALFRIAPVV